MTRVKHADPLVGDGVSALVKRALRSTPPLPFETKTFSLNDGQGVDYMPQFEF